MILEYLGKIGYRNGFAMQGFLLGIHTSIEELCKSDKKIVILGAGENGFYVEKLLQEYGLEIYAYADNSKKCQKQTIRRKQIYSPYELFKKKDNYHFIIAVQNNNIGCVRLQFMVHNVNDYSIFLNTGFHDFMDEDVELQSMLLVSINEMCLQNEEVERALPQIGVASGERGDQLGCINWLLRSTLGSHWAYMWEKEVCNKNRDAKVLEVGPGYGLMTSVLLHTHPNIFVDWIIFGEANLTLDSKKGEYERGLQKVKEKYRERIGVQYGYIERDEYVIQKKYNLIVMTEVFEHFVLNPVKTMKKLSDALEQNGRLILTTPNWGHVHIYDSWSELPGSEEVDITRYLQLTKCVHTYQYRKDELFEIFEKAELVVEKYELADENNHNFLLKRKDID